MDITNTINIFTYWGQGINEMPELLKTIYYNNLSLCKKNNLNLILLDDSNIHKYIKTHSRFNSLAYNFKSDIIRYSILNKYGGFWFDTDVLIIKDLTNEYKSLMNDDNLDIIVDVEHLWDEGIDGLKFGSSSLCIKKKSICSRFCLEYINNILDKNNYLDWNDIGPFTILNLYKNHKKRIKVNNFEITSKGCNTIIWLDNPGFNKSKWLFKNKEDAKEKALFLKKNDRCHYLITWTIYNKNNITGNLTKEVLYNRKSIFSYFIFDNKYIDPKLPNLYIYSNFNFYNKYREPYFEECSVIEKYFFENLKEDKYLNLVKNYENAEIAFIPITPASHIYEKGLNSFREHYDNFINKIKFDKKIPNFIIYPYTFYNKDYTNISFIDKRIFVLSFENEITNFDFGLDLVNQNPKINYSYNSITIPFHLKKINDFFSRCTGIKDTNKIDFNLKRDFLFSFVGMPSEVSKEYTKLYPDRTQRIKNYRENVLNEFIKNYGKKNFIIGRPNKHNAFDIYKKSKYALIFRGDCMTRAGFYQALMAGCVPIICNDCFLDYQNYNGIFYNLENMVIKIPYYNQVNNKEVFNVFASENIWNNIDRYLKNDNLRLEKLKYIKDIIQYIDYNQFTNSIRNPIYYGIKSVIETNSGAKKYKSIYFYQDNRNLLSSFDIYYYNSLNNIITGENQIFENIFKNIYKTYDINKSDYILIPLLFTSCEKIDIIPNKNYILIIDNFDEKYFSQILKFPKNTIIFYQNIYENKIIKLENYRLRYFGEQSQENTSKLLYGDKYQGNLFSKKFKENSNIKNIVFYNQTENIYMFNNENFEGNFELNFDSYVKSEDYMKYINSNYKLIETNMYQILNYISYNYL